MKTHIKLLSLISSCAISSGMSLDAATILSDSFEGSSGNWTLTNSSALYTYASGTNYATTGTGAINVTDGNATLPSAMTLDLWGAADITISFDVKWNGGSSTNRSFIELSLDGGTNWLSLGNIQNASPYNDAGGTGIYSVSLTLTEGSGQTNSATLRTVPTQYTGQTFTDSTLLRFRDSGSNPAYVDNLSITSATAVIPEPSAALIGGLGLLFLLRRRR